MPPRDPRLCPDLERALPADDEGATDYHDVREGREVLFGDGRWRFVTVRGWWRDSSGRVVVCLEWSIGGETWTETYRAAAEKIRKIDGDDAE